MWQPNNNKTPVRWHMTNHEPLKKKEEERDQIVKDDLVNINLEKRDEIHTSLRWILHISTSWTWHASLS